MLGASAWCWAFLLSVYSLRQCPGHHYGASSLLPTVLSSTCKLWESSLGRQSWWHQLLYPLSPHACPTFCASHVASPSVSALRLVCRRNKPWLVRISAHQEPGDSAVRTLLNSLASAESMEAWFHWLVYPVSSNWGYLPSQDEEQNFPKCH